MMIVSSEWVTPTRATGMVAYGFAAICCGFTWARTKSGRRMSRLAAILTFLEIALFLDIIFNWRWLLHQALMDEALQRNLYSERRGPQAFVLGVFAVLFAGCILLLLRRLANRTGALIAAFGGLLSVALWLTEVISLHAVDSITEHQFGKWLAVSFMWLVASIVTSTGILIESHAARSR